jgi:hypothetical protein
MSVSAAPAGVGPWRSGHSCRTAATAGQRIVLLWTRPPHVDAGGQNVGVTRTDQITWFRCGSDLLPHRGRSWRLRAVRRLDPQPVLPPGPTTSLRGQEATGGEEPVTATSIDSLPSAAELELLLKSARLPAQDRAAELSRRVSGLLACGLTATAVAVFLWDTVQLVGA